MMTLVLRLSNRNWALRLLTLIGFGGALISGVGATPAAADVFTGTDVGASSDVKAFDALGVTTKDFLAYPGFTGGVRVAAGDVNGDGLGDIITGAGPGGGGHIKVFAGDSGATLQSFFAYGPSFTGGVFVGGGDADNDGIDDIVTGVDAEFAPHVKVFSGATGAELRSFFAFDPGFTGGVRVAAGDVNNDGFSDIITGAGAGGGAHVKVFSGANGSELRSFFAYGPSFTGGVFVGGGDVDRDGIDDVITGAGSGAGPHVKVFSGADGSELRSFFAYTPSFTGGVRVAGGDVDGDGFADIITGAGDAGAGHVKVFSGATGAELQSFFAYGSRYNGGVFVAASTFVPEPSGAILLLGGALGLVARRRRLTA
jgi:hypothetical protein